MRLAGSRLALDYTKCVSAIGVRESLKNGMLVVPIDLTCISTTPVETLNGRMGCEEDCIPPFECLSDENRLGLISSPTG
ncbi:hypothetical protein C7G42_14770 [Bradyrhizobium sp. MOS003]|nr:hypothetical protein C7G42_14770 [Bradyrhizobium sp. MOS003]